MSNASDRFRRKIRVSKKEFRDVRKLSESEKNFDREVLRRLGYYVGIKLDSGTFSSVRYAEQTTYDGIVPLAVKVINTAKAPVLFKEEFVLQEVTIGRRIRHPYIIQYDIPFYIQDRVYVFMELAPRGSVSEYVLSLGAVEEDMAHEWCRRMFEALRYLHEKGIVHGDLNCDNLLLDRYLQLKIGDFGLSHWRYDHFSGKPILSDSYYGSPSYVAPEVIQRRPYDPAPADVWSAGVCTYVILNAALPFDDSNIVKMHEDQITRNWIFAPEVQSKLSPEAKELMIRMMEPSVSERPTIEQVLESSWM